MKLKSLIPIILSICSIIALFSFISINKVKIQKLEHLNQQQQEIIQHQGLLIIHQSTMIDDLANTLWDKYDDDLPQFDGDTQDKILEETEIIDSLYKTYKL